MAYHKSQVRGAEPRKAEDIYGDCTKGTDVHARRSALTPDPWDQGHTVTYTVFTDHGSYTHSDRVSAQEFICEDYVPGYDQFRF
ncbi:hypothetical protein LSH36_19g12006 [Paralvinella palmiformis]|uniref:Uncharacterized protein n=1 Tax=Paralvinella palmiformis TaxID=53620 RepID=A0AAD9NGZ9_9ANNE|nr:hypothetical protein LSH36_19g12006 [Paralvinella palmiformis]